MELKVKFPKNINEEDIGLFFETEKNGFSDEENLFIINGKLVKIGYRAEMKNPIISIEKKDGYFVINIDAEIVD